MGNEVMHGFLDRHERGVIAERKPYEDGLPMVPC
jgi:hypothetical protein